MIKIVVDTNIVISALLNPKRNPSFVISLILGGKLKLCLSKAIFKEYKEVLSRPKFSKLDRGAIREMLTLLKEISLWVDPIEKVDLIKEDPDDNIFLECAQEANADFIITGNNKHFPKSIFKTALIVNPSEFIELVTTDIFTKNIADE